MGVCKARETATTTATTHSHDGRQEKDQRPNGNGGGAPGPGTLDTHGYGCPRNTTVAPAGRWPIRRSSPDWNAVSAVASFPATPAAHGKGEHTIVSPHYSVLLLRTPDTFGPRMAVISHFLKASLAQ